MIIVRLQGGLGNQLFIYAAYKYFSEYYDDCYMEVSDYNLPVNNGYREYLLNYFTTQNIKLCKIVDKKPFFKDKSEFKITYFSREEIKNFPVFDSDRLQNGVDDVCKMIVDNAIVEGYFWKKKVLTTSLLQSLFFKNNVPANQSIKDKYDEIISCNSVCVHVRRGDYVNLSHFANICTVNYYKKAIEYISSKIENPQFYFFSEDIDYLKENFKNENFHYIENLNYLNNTIDDLFLMSSCKHIILANSSYSFWSTVLNRNIGKIIVAPRFWNNIDCSTELNYSTWVTI